jgi:hypothetical protein
MARDPASLEAGEPSRQVMHERLSAANYFVLFHTIDNTNWDWCMYEGGVFEGIRAGAKREHVRTIGILPRDAKVPEPLRQLQACWADKEQVRDQFVLKLIDDVGLTDPANDPTLQEDIEKLCDVIVAVFRPYTALRELQLMEGGRALLPTITFSCRLKDVADHKVFFANATVTISASAGTILKIGVQEQISFDRFCKLAVVTSPWVAELKNALLRVMAAPDEIDPWQIIIVSHIGQHRHVYRPVLTDAYTLDDRVCYDICLVELLDDSDQYAPSLNRCFRLLRICHSYRVELIEALRNLVAPPLQTGKLVDVQRTLENLQSRATQYGFEEGENPIANLPERDELLKAAAYFRTLEDGLAVYVQCIAFSLPADDLFAILRLGFDQVNGRWLHVLASTYSERVSQHKPAGSVPWEQDDATLQSLLKTFKQKLEAMKEQEGDNGGAAVANS